MLLWGERRKGERRERIKERRRERIEERRRERIEERGGKVRMTKIDGEC